MCMPRVAPATTLGTGRRVASLSALRSFGLRMLARPPSGAAELALAGWRDLAEGLGPTCRPGSGRHGRRIYRAYANATAAQLARSVQLQWDTGISTYAAIEVLLAVGEVAP